MPEYLTKEEIKQWRSSLEKITLEEFAKRLGKQIEEEKHTNDLVDIVMKGQSSSSVTTYRMDRSSSIERISAVSQKAERVERELSKSVYAPKAEPVKEVKAEKAIISEKIDSSGFEFKKPLTEREQMVFNYFLANKDTVVFAKDLAKLLNLPRDYVYKYIKTLRAKIEGDNLKNAESGGFILSDK